MSEPFTGRPEAECIPIHPLTPDGLKAWREGAVASERNWVDAQAFAAEPGQVCQVPDGEGRTARVLVGVERPGAVYGLGALPYLLPPGDYRLASDWDEAEQEKTLVGWALIDTRLTL